MNAFDFNTDFMRFDPFGYRNPANETGDYEPEYRNCECCGDTLALTDEGTTCAACTEVCEADAAFHATL